MTPLYKAESRIQKSGVRIKTKSGLAASSFWLLDSDS
jgi:hypothetical protein